MAKTDNLLSKLKKVFEFKKRMELSSEEKLLLDSIASGQMQAVSVLLKKGVNVNISEPKYGYSPIIVAAEKGHLNIVKMLIEHGVDTNAKTIENNTALIWACDKGFADIVRLLIDNGADVNAKNTLGETPLEVASVGGFVEIVSLLLKAGADINVKNRFGATPLEYAIHHGRHEVVKLIEENMKGRNQK